jgi:phosphoribosylformylglycinamidine synthase
MRFRLTVEVTLKPGHSDPEGETTARLLKELGYKIETVSVGKIYNVIIEAHSKREAETKADEVCKRLLANPTKDSYSIKVEETR